MKNNHASLVVELSALLTALVFAVPAFIVIAVPLVLLNVRWHLAAGIAALVALPLLLLIRAYSLPVAERHARSKNQPPT